jgi:hypothetical protein
MSSGLPNVHQDYRKINSGLPKIMKITENQQWSSEDNEDYKTISIGLPNVREEYRKISSGLPNKR